MFLTNLFNLKKVCQHEHISPNVERAYCPDCGELVENHWYIARCACCGVKIKASLKNGKVIAQNHFCTNCGSDEFITEKLEQINFIDINFAVLKRVTVKQGIKVSSTQCWQERSSVQPKLLVQYL